MNCHLVLAPRSWLAGVMRAEAPGGDAALDTLAKRWRRTARDTRPDWLHAAAELLDKYPGISDRAIARRLRLAHSTLLRNKIWRRVRVEALRG
jgi:hypothetical protein